ncbi:hypothetical protein DFH09DRAFT_1421746, partial [Mycena vulgaris]
WHCPIPLRALHGLRSVLHRCLLSGVAPSLLTQSHRPPSLHFPLPCCHSSPSLVPFRCLRVCAISSLPPLRLSRPRHRSPLTSRRPIRFLPRPVSSLTFFSASPRPPSRFFPAPSILPIPPPPAPVTSPPSLLPAIPILSPRVPVPPPRIHALLIPAPRPSRFFPHFLLPCFLPVRLLILLASPRLSSLALTPPRLPPSPSLTSPRCRSLHRSLPPLFLPHSLSSPPSSLRAPLRPVPALSPTSPSPSPSPSIYLLRVSSQTLTGPHSVHSRRRLRGASSCLGAVMSSYASRGSA